MRAKYLPFATTNKARNLIAKFLTKQSSSISSFRILNFEEDTSTNKWTADIIVKGDKKIHIES